MESRDYMMILNLETYSIKHCQSWIKIKLSTLQDFNISFFNLDFVDCMNCQQINKAINQSQCFDSRNGGSIEVCQKNPLFSQKVHFLRDFFIDPYPKTNFVK